MRNHRMLTLAGAGSAVAATIAVWALLFVPTPQTTVEAATIFASFRDALANAFDISFEDVGAEGIRVSGRLVVVFDHGSEQAAPLESEAEGVYVEAQVQADETADEDVAGLDMQAAVSVVPDNEWAFVQIVSLPHQVLAEEPIARIFQQMACDGLLLDLDGLMEGDLADEILAELPFAQAAADAEEQGGQQHPSKTIVIRAGEPAVIQQPGPDDVDAPSGAGLEEDDLDEMFTKLLTGKGTAEDFEQLVSLIEQAATDVTVVETEPGLHVLTATGFTFEDDEEAAALLGQMVLRIAYRQEHGLVWATLEHVGLYDGTIRFQMTDLTTDDELFNRERFMADGKARRFDVAQLVSMFEGTQDE